MKELEELTREIQEKIPRLIELPIIGLDPMLNDVMEYLSIKAVEFAFTQNGFYAYDNDIERWGDFIPVNLGSPYLKDQSPELIKFLHGLINH